MSLNGLNRRPLFSTARAPVPPRGRRWGIFGLWFRRVLTVLGGLFLFSLLATCAATVALVGGPQKKLPRKMVLTMTLDSDYPEYQTVSNPLEDSSPTFSDIIDAFDRAGKDKRVKGLVVDLEDAPLSLGHIEELRAALQRFRQAGKFAYIYAPSYGEPGRGLGTYYFASGFDQIWMQPVGVLSMAGISAEMPFARRGLDKLGVQPEFFQRKEYKSLFESFDNNQMSPASHEEMTSLVNDLADQFAGGIAEARKMTPAAVKALVDKGVFTDKEALAAGLVTTLDGYDALEDKVSHDVTGKKDSGKKDVTKADNGKKDEDKADKEDLFVDIERYAADNGKDHPSPGLLGHKKTAALVFIEGTIVDAGEGQHSTAALGGEMAPAANVSDDILDAADDPDVGIIVVRINSPGGSPSASETIRRALERAKGKGKKIIISMGDETASGGYWIACAGDRIFALPGTLTGSIGVAGGKFVLTDMWKKLGVNWESVDYGANAGMWSFNRPFSKSAAERMNAMMDEVYENFTAHVAEGRHMTPAQVEAVARGRVWTGRQAKENGLVDELGGLDAALDYAAVQLGAKDRAHLQIDMLPRPESAFERLQDLLGQSRLASPINAALLPRMRELSHAFLADQFMTYEPVTVR